MIMNLNNFLDRNFANVKCHTFTKLQFLIVFCKTLLSHYNRNISGSNYSTVTLFAKFLG